MSLRRLLFWGRMTPLETFPLGEILMKNRLNSNSGNLLFYSGVARAVMTDDVTLVHFFREDVEKLIGDMDAVNADYDGVVTAGERVSRGVHPHPAESGALPRPALH